MRGPIPLGEAVASVIADLDIRRRCVCPGAKYGLWNDSTPQSERTARLRALRALVMVFGGPAGVNAEKALATAENDPEMILDAIESFDRLPALTIRRALSTYAALHNPGKRGDNK